MKKLIIFLIIAATSRCYAQSFSKVELQTLGKVIITQGESNSVTTSDGNKANTTIKDNTLIINGTENKDYQVTMKDIEKLSISGNGEIDATNTISSADLTLDISGNGKMTLPLKVADLHIDINGVGKMNLSGTAENAVIKISGSGKVEAFDLKTQYCKADVTGVGKCNVDVVQGLIRDVSGMGSVNYKTRPQTVKGENGTSEINDEEKPTDKIDKADTTHFKWGDADVLIIRSDSIKKAMKKKQTHTHPIWQGLEIGLNNYVNENGDLIAPVGYGFLDLNTGKSVSVSLNLFQKNIQFGHSNVWFFTGLGVTWNNYRFDNNVFFSTNPDYISGGKDTTSAYNYIKSKLTTSYLMVPVMFEVFTAKRYKDAFHIGAGGIFGYRLGAHTKQKYEFDSKTYKPKVYDDFYLNPLRYGVRAALGFGKFNVFADYYFSTLFRNEKGPVLNPVNFGITLIPF